MLSFLRAALKTILKVASSLKKNGEPRAFVSMVRGLCFSLFVFILFAGCEPASDPTLLNPTKTNSSETNLGEKSLTKNIAKKQPAATEEKTAGASSQTKPKLALPKKTSPPQAPRLTTLAYPYAKSISPPSLRGNLDWINSEKPLSYSDLQGKFILLDFWTYCCINCIHVIPELHKLEAKYPKNLVVLGIHSAKFDSEGITKNIQEAVARYEIKHPVINDPDLLLWNRFGVRSWPTIILLDPNGKIFWVKQGEVTAEQVSFQIEKGLPYFRQQGLLNENLLSFQKPARPSTTPLRFPGKVLADQDSNQLFISDSNHNQIIITDLQGKHLATIGSGHVGRADGTYETASLNHPQGVALEGNLLFIADTENHLIRQVNLSTKQVTTLAGTGAQRRERWPGTSDLKRDALGRYLNPPKRWSGPPNTTPLNSPWAVTVYKKRLYIAMAGAHQIWDLPLTGEDQKVGIYAGNGREDIVDGPLIPPQPYAFGFSSFAQPSGFTTNGRELFIADSEGSAIRAIPFYTKTETTQPKKHTARTLVGTRGSLFDFGDREGSFRQTRLQHALGIAYQENKIYVADTYNNKIKMLDLQTNQTETIAGTGKPGSLDATRGSEATFNEPAGLSIAGNKLYVADTNSHLIRVIQLKKPYPVTTLQLGPFSKPNQQQPKPL